MVILLIFAFLAGIVTVLSPCVLPILPALLAAGMSKGTYRPLGIIIGLITSFSFFTLMLTAFFESLGLSANVLHYTAILVIGFFGAILIFPYLSDWFANYTSWIVNWGNQMQSQQTDYSSGFFSGIFLGIALGLVWTPCAGPILATITALVATQHVNLKIVALTLAYSIGAGLPLFLIAYGSNRVLLTLPQLSYYTEEIRKGFGWLMLLAAIALAFNLDTVFQQFVLKHLPNIQVENGQWVEKQLNQIRPPPVGFPDQEFSPTVKDPNQSETDPEK